VLHQVAVTLRGGTVLDTWSRYRVTIDMLQPGSPWTFELYASESRRTTLDVLRNAARLGEQLYVWIDEAVQLSGRIEHIHEEADVAGGFRVTVGGRDLAGPAIDCEAEPTIKLRHAALDDALRALFDPLALRLFISDAAAAADCHALRNRRRSQRSGGGRRRGRRRRSRHGSSRRAPIDVFKIQPGDTVWGVAKNLCSKAGYLIWTAPHPDPDTTTGGIGVVVDSPLEDGEPAYALERKLLPDGRWRSQMLHTSYELKLNDIPTEVTAFASARVGHAGQDVRARVVVFNDGLTHPRVVPDLMPQPHFLKSRTAKTAAAVQREGQRYMAMKMAGFRVYECTVIGHGQTGPDGVERLWTVNELCHLLDERHGLDEPMLITRVTFDGARADGEGGGQTTTLRMVPRGAVKVFPEPTPG
jgi:prophage tail gpP-like protein